MDLNQELPPEYADYVNEPVEMIQAYIRNTLLAKLQSEEVLDPDSMWNIYRFFIAANRKYQGSRIIEEFDETNPDINKENLILQAEKLLQPHIHTLPPPAALTGATIHRQSPSQSSRHVWGNTKASSWQRTIPRQFGTLSINSDPIDAGPEEEILSSELQGLVERLNKELANVNNETTNSTHILRIKDLLTNNNLRGAIDEARRSREYQYGGRSGFWARLQGRDPIVDEFYKQLSKLNINDIGNGKYKTYFNLNFFLDKNQLSDIKHISHERVKTMDRLFSLPTFCRF